MWWLIIKYRMYSIVLSMNKELFIIVWFRASNRSRNRMVGWKWIEDKSSVGFNNFISSESQSWVYAFIFERLTETWYHKRFIKIYLSTHSVSAIWPIYSSSVLSQEIFILVSIRLASLTIFFVTLRCMNFIKNQFWQSMLRGQNERLYSSELINQKWIYFM